jgi:hypothetical protein
MQDSGKKTKGHERGLVFVAAVLQGTF